MTQDKVKKIHLIYGCIATVLIIALGIALMVSCWQIYQSGSHPYTRASIGEKLQQIAVLIYTNAAVIVGGFVLNLLLPMEKAKTKAVRDDLVLMNKMAAKAGEPSDIVKAQLSKEQSLQKSVPFVTALVYIALMIYPAIYMFNTDHFSGVDPTAEIMKAALIVLPFALIGLVLCYICSIVVTSSIQRQTAVYKQIIASGNKKAPAASQEKKELPIGLIRCVILIVAVVFIVVGVFNGSAQDVLTKAIKICTECIGLG